MKIYNKIIVSMITGEVLEEDSFEYHGEVLLARGGETSAQKQAAAASQAEQQKVDAFNQQMWNQTQQQLSAVMPKYQNLYDNPMSDVEKSSRLDLAGGPFSAAQSAAEHRAATSGNWAGVNEAEDSLAMDRSKALSTAQGSIDSDIQQRQMAALAGMSSLYGVDMNTVAKTMGLPAEYVNQQVSLANTAAQQPSFWDQFALGLLNNAGQIGKGFTPNG